jgi:hypothetical protein
MSNGKGRFGKLGSNKGTTPFRRGEKSSELRVGTGTDGNPAIFANVGGKVYSTPLSLVNLGQDKGSLDLTNVNIANAVNIDNTGVRLKGALKFAPSADTNIIPPSGETWIYVHRPEPVTVNFVASGSDNDTVNTTVSDDEYEITISAAHYSGGQSFGSHVNYNLTGGMLINTSVSQNMSAPITAHTDPKVIRIRKASQINISNGHVLVAQGPVRVYFVFHDGYHTYNFRINLNNVTETNSFNGVWENLGKSVAFSQASDAPAYNSGGSSGDPGKTAGGGLEKGTKENIVL